MQVMRNDFRNVSMFDGKGHVVKKYENLTNQQQMRYKRGLSRKPKWVMKNGKPHWNGSRCQKCQEDCECRVF